MPALPRYAGWQKLQKFSLPTLLRVTRMGWPQSAQYSRRYLLCGILEPGRPHSEAKIAVEADSAETPVIFVPQIEVLKRIFCRPAPPAGAVEPVRAAGRTTSIYQSLHYHGGVVACSRLSLSKQSGESFRHRITEKFFVRKVLRSK